MHSTTTVILPDHSSVSFDRNLQVLFIDNKRLLLTMEELQKHAFAQLGKMDECSYESFQNKMRDIAQQNNIVKPLMAIYVKYKSGKNTLVSEQPFPGTKLHWSILEENITTDYETTPEIFAIDSEKFIVPL